MSGAAFYSLKHNFEYPLLFLPKSIIELEFFEPDANASGTYEMTWHGVRINQTQMKDIERIVHEIKNYAKYIQNC